MGMSQEMDPSLNLQRNTVILKEVKSKVDSNNKNKVKESRPSSMQSQVE